MESLREFTSPAPQHDVSRPPSVLSCRVPHRVCCSLCDGVLDGLSDVYPSFVLMAIQGDVVVTFVYELHGNDMKVTKSTFSKKKTTAE